MSDEREITRDKRRVLEHLQTARKFMPYLHSDMSAHSVVKLLGSRDRAQRALVALVQDKKIRYLENCSPDHYQAYAEVEPAPTPGGQGDAAPAEIPAAELAEAEQRARTLAEAERMARTKRYASWVLMAEYDARGREVERLRGVVYKLGADLDDAPCTCADCLPELLAADPIETDAEAASGEITELRRQRDELALDVARLSGELAGADYERDQLRAQVASLTAEHAAPVDLPARFRAAADAAKREGYPLLVSDLLKLALSIEKRPPRVVEAIGRELLGGGQ